MEDTHFLRDLNQLKMCIEFRRDDFKTAGRTRAASVCVRCIGELQDLELIVKRDMKKKSAPRGRD